MTDTPQAYSWIHQLFQETCLPTGRYEERKACRRTTHRLAANREPWTWQPE